MYSVPHELIRRNFEVAVLQMGCVMSNNNAPLNPEDAELKKINKAIDIQLKEDKKKMQNVVKILLLGCGEAGKSTFIKQMKILHSEEKEKVWTEDELKGARRDILSNAVECLQVLLEEVQKPLGEGLGNTADRLKKLDKSKEEDQVRLWEWRDTVQDIWEDPAIQDTYNRRNEFSLPDCCRHFLSNISRISNPDFVATTQDILMVRVQTTGIIEYNFPLVFRKDLTRDCIFIDVGGQRNERKKWIHCFSDVLMVLFLAAASEYDQMLYEDITENRMDESLSLFNKIISYNWFSNCSIALFLNKKDLLEEKIQKSPLEDYFEEFKSFTGCKCCRSDGFKTRDFRAAMDFIKHKFREEHMAVENSEEWQRISVDGSRRSLFVHETMATDTDNIKKVFDAVKKTIMNRILEQFGVN